MNTPPKKMPGKPKKIYPDEAFAAALGFLLHKKGLSQLSLAKQVGVSQSYINKIKSNKARGGIRLLHSIAKAMDTSYHDMIIMGESLLRGRKLSSEEKSTLSDANLFDGSSLDQFQQQGLIKKIIKQLYDIEQKNPAMLVNFYIFLAGFKEGIFASDTEDQDIKV